MYQQLPSFVLGFHGCDRKIGEAVLAGAHVVQSANDYDWLGEGAYFWGNSPERALSYAKHIKRHATRAKGSIKDPFVLGAVIDLGLCLSLTDEGACLASKAISYRGTPTARSFSLMPKQFNWGR